jgi:hypothetical protein
MELREIAALWDDWAAMIETDPTQLEKIHFR